MLSLVCPYYVWNVVWMHRRCFIDVNSDDKKCACVWAILWSFVSTSMCINLHPLVHVLTEPTGAPCTIESYSISIETFALNGCFYTFPQISLDGGMYHSHSVSMKSFITISRQDSCIEGVRKGDKNEWLRRLRIILFRSFVASQYKCQFSFCFIWHTEISSKYIVR